MAKCGGSGGRGSRRGNCGWSGGNGRGDNEALAVVVVADAVVVMMIVVELWEFRKETLSLVVEVLK